MGKAIAVAMLAVLVVMAASGGQAVARSQPVANGSQASGPFSIAFVATSKPPQDAALDGTWTTGGSLVQGGKLIDGGTLTGTVRWSKPSPKTGTQHFQAILTLNGQLGSLVLRVTGSASAPDGKGQRTVTGRLVLVSGSGAYKGDCWTAKTAPGSDIANDPASDLWSISSEARNIGPCDVDANAAEGDPENDLNDVN